MVFRVNASAISADNHDLMIALMIDSHGQMEKDLLWSMVEEYAEEGIAIPYSFLQLSERVLDVETISG